jgi:Tol biopolymer transport system component
MTIRTVRPKKLFLALMVATISVLGVVQGAQSTTPGANGLIVYGQEVAPDHYQLFTIRPDGSGRRQVTRGAASSLNADWAPSGRSLVYELDRSGTADTAGIAVATATGAKQRILTPKGYQGQPSFSPDGKWIVFERDSSPTSNGIWLIRPNGSGRRQLTRNPYKTFEQCGCDTDPNFSPDGRWITFVRIKKDEELQALFAVRPNGSGLHQITPYSWQVAIKHDWSPDGKSILLTTNADFVRPEQSANMVTIRPDGTGKTEVTHFTGGRENAFAGSFSPDGKQIVFRLEEGDTYSLAVVDVSGENLEKLTTGKGKPRFIDWGTHQ